MCTSFQSSTKLRNATGNPKWDVRTLQCFARLYWACHSLKYPNWNASLCFVVSSVNCSEIIIPWHSVTVSRPFVPQLRFKMHVYACAPFFLKLNGCNASQRVQISSNSVWLNLSSRLVLGLSQAEEKLCSQTRAKCLNMSESSGPSCRGHHWMTHASIGLAIAISFTSYPDTSVGSQQWSSNEMSSSPLKERFTASSSLPAYLS